MVFKLQFQFWNRLQNLAKPRYGRYFCWVVVSFVLVHSIHSSVAVASSDNALRALRLSDQFYRKQSYFESARYAFGAVQLDESVSASGYAQVSRALIQAGLYQSASYFFIRTLKSGNRKAIRKVLRDTEELLVALGGDILKNYLVEHTRVEDYSGRARSAFLYSMGKDALLSGQEKRAIQFLKGIDRKSALYAPSLQLRGTANAILGSEEKALASFRECAQGGGSKANWLKDLSARCRAGEARTLYQMGRFRDADRVYDLVPKASFVWTDTLFEQAWNAFARKDYNRALGKLVSYKNPSLNFVFNSEIDVLRAQSFLALCLYNDVNKVVGEFNRKYARTGDEVKRFIEKNRNNLYQFYRVGKKALSDKLHTRNRFHKILNRFVRGPYFQNRVLFEDQISGELEKIRSIAAGKGSSTQALKSGFPAFLSLVLKWRKRTAQLLGGIYVRNSLIDHHSILVSDFEKISFIKLEMLNRAKDQLIAEGRKQNLRRNRFRGGGPARPKEDQFFWSFNGEFWNDEIGDYVFSLESKCKI